MRQSISLSRLRRLSLTSFDGCSAYSWSLLDTPSDCRTTVVNSSSSWDSLQHYLLPKLKASVRHDRAPNFDSMEVALDEPEERQFRLNTSRRFTISCGAVINPYDMSSFFDQEEPPIIRVTALHDQTGLANRILSPLIELFPSATSLRHLRIGHITFSGFAPREIFKDATEVQTIHFAESLTATVAEFLPLIASHAPPRNPHVSSDEANAVAVATSHDRAAFYWPSLYSLSFSNIDLGPDESYGVWDMLRDAVRTRAENGARIQTIIVRECALPEEFYNNWKAGGPPEEMPELDWDFIQGHYQSDEEDEDGDESESDFAEISDDE